MNERARESLTVCDTPSSVLLLIIFLHPLSPLYIRSFTGHCFKLDSQVTRQRAYFFVTAQQTINCTYNCVNEVTLLTLYIFVVIRYFHYLIFMASLQHRIFVDLHIYLKQNNPENLNVLSSGGMQGYSFIGLFLHKDAACRGHHCSKLSTLISLSNALYILKSC